jgi:hypothetical protein
MIAKSDAASIFRGTRGSRSIEISVPGAFTAVGFSGQQKNPGASAAERGRPSLFKTIDEDRRQRHDQHQPLRQIHLSRKNFCPNKRSHPSNPSGFAAEVPKWTFLEVLERYWKVGRGRFGLFRRFSCA